MVHVPPIGDGPKVLFTVLHRVGFWPALRRRPQASATQAYGENHFIKVHHGNISDVYSGVKLSTVHDSGIRLEGRRSCDHQHF